jgi:hypothetical protein
MAATVHIFPGAILRPTDYYGYPTVGASRRVKASILGVIHCTDGFGIPSPSATKSWTFSVAADGTVYQFMDPVIAAPWTNGDIKSPDTSNPLVKAMVGSSYNPNEFCFVTIENVCYVSGGQRLTQAQLDADHRILEWGSKLSGLPLDRTHVIGHYQINGETRVNCPTVPSDRQRVFDGVLGTTTLPDTSVEEDMPLLHRKFEPWTFHAGAKVYAAPSLDAAVLTTLAGGPGVTIAEEATYTDGKLVGTGDWRLIVLADDRLGWVYRADMDPLISGGFPAFDSLVKSVLMESDINVSADTVTPPASVAAAAVTAATTSLTRRIASMKQKVAALAADIADD